MTVTNVELAILIVICLCRSVYNVYLDNKLRNTEAEKMKILADNSRLEALLICAEKTG